MKFVLEFNYFFTFKYLSRKIDAHSILQFHTIIWLTCDPSVLGGWDLITGMTHIGVICTYP